jgi:TonB family protein
MKSRSRTGFADPFRAAVLGCTLALALLPLRPAHAQSSRVKDFHIRPGTDTATSEDRSAVSIQPRRGSSGGLLLWQCVERGGLAVGVLVLGTRDGGSRPLAWRFDRDRPHTATASAIPTEGYWYLPAEDVAPFTLRARQARRLVVNVPGTAGSPAPLEFVYEMDGAGEALDRLSCARSEPVAGRPILQRELGLGPPPDEGNYELAAVEVMPRITNGAAFQELVADSFPPALVGTGIRGQVRLRLRVQENGRVDSASVQVVESTHEALNALAVMAGRRLVMTPALVNNRPVAVWVELPFAFVAPDAEPAAAPPPP